MVVVGCDEHHHNQQHISTHHVCHPGLPYCCPIRHQGDNMAVCHRCSTSLGNEAPRKYWGTIRVPNHDSTGQAVMYAAYGVGDRPA